MRADNVSWIRRVGSMALLLAGLAALQPGSARAELADAGVRFSGLWLFPKWEATLRRFEAQNRLCGEHACEDSAWNRLLAGLRGLDRDALIRAVERRVNALPYVTDRQAWRQADYWATPFEFLDAGGDCEDFAVTKYLALRSAGIAAESMRIAVVWDRSRQLHHAVLLVDDDGETLVLDNLAPRVRSWAEARSYVPIYSINETRWWLHQPVPIGGRATLPSLGLGNGATRAEQGVEESDSNAAGSRGGGAVR